MASKIGGIRDAQQQPKPSKPPKRRKVTTSAGADSVLASQCMKLHLVSSADDLLNSSPSTSQDLSFPPVFLERFFGDDGRIRGYEDLKVDVWLHARSFHAYAEVHFSSEIQSASPKRKTDLRSKLQEVFQGALVEDRQTFIDNFASYDSIFEATLKNDGELVTSWEASPLPDGNQQTLPGSDCQGSDQLEIWRFNMEGERVKEWQSRISNLALLFIDGANAIDVDDPLWEIYICTKRNLPAQGTVPLSRVVGFAAVYRFYHHPESTRLRLSQILVLPPYQGRQYGYQIVVAVNSQAVKRDCYDLTMEDPSESLQALRDCMDVLRLNSFGPVKPAVEAAIAALRTHANNADETNAVATVSTTASETADPEETALKDKGQDLLLPPRPLVDSARRTFKICSLQLKRCWEILLCMHTNSSDPAVERALKDILVSRIKSSLVGKNHDKSRSNKGKHVIVTENEYGNEKTFVMFRANPKEVQAIVEDHRVGGDGEGSDDTHENGDNPAAEEEGKPDPAKVEEAVEALLKDKLADIEKVVTKVRHLSMSGGDAGTGVNLLPPSEAN